MYKACVVFLIMVLTTGCEKQVIYHQNIWSGRISKYCNSKSYNRNQESVGVMNDNSNQERQNQYNKNSLNSNKESMQGNVKNNRDVSKIELTNTHKKNNGISKSKTDTLSSVDLEANMLKLNQVLNRNSKQSELARQEGQANNFSKEAKNNKIANKNNKNLSEGRGDTIESDVKKNGIDKNNKKNNDLTKQSDINLKEGSNRVNSFNNIGVVNDRNASIATKKNKEVLDNDTREFNSVKNEFSFGGL